MKGLFFMAYQRAQWQSGLTYQQVCETCKNTFRYTDQSLDFRPWYPDGYVDCPVCKSHLRHNEKYAIDAPNKTNVVSADNIDNFTEVYCPKCGNKFGANHSFCCKCGAKRN